MGHTKDQDSRRFSSPPKRPGMCGSVDANQLSTNRFAMDHIIGDCDHHIRFPDCTTDSGQDLASASSFRAYETRNHITFGFVQFGCCNYAMQRWIFPKETSNIPERIQKFASVRKY